MVATQLKSPSADRYEGPLRTGALVSAYRIERLIGSGGMGWVYRARHILGDHDPHQMTAEILVPDDSQLEPGRDEAEPKERPDVEEIHRARLPVHRTPSGG